MLHTPLCLPFPVPDFVGLISVIFAGILRYGFFFFLDETWQPLLIILALFVCTLLTVMGNTTAVSNAIE